MKNGTLTMNDGRTVGFADFGSCRDIRSARREPRAAAWPDQRQCIRRRIDHHARLPVRVDPVRRRDVHQWGGGLRRRSAGQRKWMGHVRRHADHLSGHGPPWRRRWNDPGREHAPHGRHCARGHAPCLRWPGSLEHPDQGSRGDKRVGGEDCGRAIVAPGSSRGPFRRRGSASVDGRGARTGVVDCP